MNLKVTTKDKSIIDNLYFSKMGKEYKIILKQSSNHKGREPKKKGAKNNYINNPKAMKKNGNKYLPIKNYFTCKQSFNQKCRLAEWIHTHIYTAYDTQFSVKDTYRLKMKGWKKGFHENEYETKSGIATFILEKIDLKTVTRGKKELYIMIKKLLQEDVKLVNIYAPKYIKQVLTNVKEETDRSTIPRDDSKPVTSMERSSRPENQLNHHHHIHSRALLRHIAVNQ